MKNFISSIMAIAFIWTIIEAAAILVKIVVVGVKRAINFVKRFREIYQKEKMRAITQLRAEN